MKRITIAKVSEISAGSAFILLGILMYGLGFVSMLYGDESPLLMLLMLIMAISGVEAGIFWIKRFYKMKGGFEIAPPKRFIAKAASASVSLLFGITIIRIIFAIAGFVVAYYLLVKYMISGWSNIDMTWVTGYVVVLLVYVFLFRKIFKNRFVELTQDALKKTLGEYPKVEIKDNDLILHLGKGYLEKYRDLKIPLSEIDEVKVMDRYEGMAFLKYVLGPDVEFGIKTVPEKIKYQQGKIDRPKFFSYMENQTGAMTLYLAGPEMLYLVGVQDTESLKKLQITNYK